MLSVTVSKEAPLEKLLEHLMPSELLPFLLGMLYFPKSRYLMDIFFDTGFVLETVLLNTSLVAITICNDWHYINLLILSIGFSDEAASF